MVGMKKVRVEDAVGLTINHDMMKVIPGEFKGVIFKRGHVITEEDVPVLKSIGRNNIYEGDLPEGSLHEDECAERIARAIASEDEFKFSDVSTGKIVITASETGVFKIDLPMLYELNNIEHVSICTILDNTVVNKGQAVASERIIPMFTKEENITKLEELCAAKKLLSIKPFKNKKVHLIVTGNEVYNGIIEDGFEKVLRPKVKEYGSEILRAVKAPDDKERIKSEIIKSLEEGPDVILLTGGMSVDEDDLTPVAIKEIADRVVIHGTPVQPGNMFLLAYKGNTAIMGLPAAVMFHKHTIFDMVFSMVASDIPVDKEFLIKLSHGGMCLMCKECHYPNCIYLKGR